MSDYNNTFTESTGDTIDTTDFSTEFSAIETAIATKADSSSPTLTSPVLNTGVSGTAVLDDDTMATATDTTLATSESIKAYVDAVLTKIASLNTKVLNIGDWNMDTTVSVTVAHGVTLSKIRSIKAIIRNDADNAVFDFTVKDWSPTSGTSATMQADATNVYLGRSTSGGFDNASFDSTGYNRGWITIQYTD